MAFLDDVAHIKQEIDARGDPEQAEAHELALALANAIRERLLQMVKKQYQFGQHTAIKYHGYMLFLDFKKTLFPETTEEIRGILKRDQLHTIGVSMLARYAQHYLQSELSSDGISVGSYILAEKPYFTDDDESFDTSAYKSSGNGPVSIQYIFVDDISFANYREMERFPRVPLPAGYIVKDSHHVKLIKDGNEVYKGDSSQYWPIVAIEVNADL